MLFCQNLEIRDLPERSSFVTWVQFIGSSSIPFNTTCTTKEVGQISQCILLALSCENNQTLHVNIDGKKWEGTPRACTILTPNTPRVVAVICFIKIV